MGLSKNRKQQERYFSSLERYSQMAYSASIAAEFIRGLGYNAIPMER